MITARDTIQAITTTVAGIQAGCGTAAVASLRNHRDERLRWHRMSVSGVKPACDGKRRPMSRSQTGLYSDLPSNPASGPDAVLWAAFVVQHARTN